MNALKRIPSCLAMVVAVAWVAGGGAGWRERLDDPATFLTALAFAGVALVLCPIGMLPPDLSRHHGSGDNNSWRRP